MAHLTTGLAAESAVASRLGSLGYKILERNWKTQACEIDLIAEKDRIIYFVEVKYRRSGEQGSGFEYVGPAKLRQVEFAGRLWCQLHNWDKDWRVLAAAVTGRDFERIDLIEVF